MSTSSNTSNSGPNRFRSDAASFSPSVPSPGVMNQQMQQQQHIYPQYMYGTPQMVPNQYYPYMTPYMMHPNAPYSDFNPYTQAYGGYPMQMPQYPGQPYPGMPNMSGGGNMNMNAMMNNRPKMNHNNKSKPYISNSNRSRSSSTVSSNVPNQYQHHQQTPPVSHPHPHPHPQDQWKHENKPENPADEKAQTDQRKSDTSSSTDTNHETSKQVKKHVTLESTTKKGQEKTPSTSSNKPMSYPLYFNETAQDFIKSQQSIASERNQLVKQKNERLNEFIRSENNEKQSLVINRNSNITIIDYNTNTTHKTIENNNYNTHRPNDNDDNNSNKFNDNSNEVDLEGEDSTDINKDNKSANWASFLQTTATVPAKKSKSQPKPSTGPSQISASSSTTGISPSTNNTQVNNILALDSSQPLGILMLKIMFDNNYSVMNSYNNCPIFRVKPRGLTNTGNICYMNAILQVLLYCEPFNKTLKLVESKSIGSLSQKSTTPLLDIVIKFWKEFSQPSNMKPISPDNFYMSLITHEKFSHLKWGQQEDAEEFLGYFLDGLHEEFVGSIKGLNTPQTDLLIQQFQQQNEDIDQLKLNAFKLNIKNTMKIIKKSKLENQDTTHQEEVSDHESNGWSEVGSNNKKISAKRTVEIEPSPITTIFGGQFRSVLQIPKNKESQSITLDPFQCIQLDISDSSITTVEDAFKQLNEPENIPYKSSSNKEVIAKKQTFIDQLPNILIIHLKRFSYQQEKEKESTPSNEQSSNTSSNGSRPLGSIEKLRKKIEYSHHLTIPNEVLSPLYKHSGNISNHYKLFGVVYHHGVSAEGGHYTSDVLRKSSVFDNEEESNDKKVDNQWIRIDDTQITELEKDEVLNGGDEETTKNAYILFYQKT